MAKVLLGLSGGMDSACAVRLLQQAGHEVVGALLEMHDGADVAGAEAAARETGIPLVRVDCRARFDVNVINPFCAEYACGRTPNPCVLCNETVKFAGLIETADRLGCKKIATGHYAAVVHGEGGFAVARAADPKKDQSYMLWRLSSDTLARLLLPLSGEIKAELRERARAAGLSSAEKSESEEICFIPDGDYAAYIERRLGRCFPEGEIVNEEGAVIGRHKGLIRYTVGQRKGIGAYGKPMFVRQIDADANRLVLAAGGGEFADTLSVDGLVFSGVLPFTGTRRFDVKLRYRAPAVPAAVTVTDGVARVRLDAPARAVTPGQSAVFYDGDTVAFGGFIR